VLELSLGAREGGPLSVVAVGSHSDDIEIGCGGTILELVDAGVPVHVTWVVLSAAGERAGEARGSAQAFLGGVESEIRLASFRDAFFPHDQGVKEFFEELKHDVRPDVILTHTRSDLHQDHRTVCELVWNTFRNHLVLEYEIPKYDGDLGSPNAFVAVQERHARRKAELLVEHFASQRDKHWFTEDLFLGLMRVRGAECRSPTGYAEGFYARKLRLGLAPA
jgi:LmbE family N-acetylglucosaminyl deacetylase